MRSFADFALVTLLSLVMWGLITVAYLETAQAFVASPQLASMTLPQCMLLLAFSGGASALQLPVLGWFTQIGIVAAALTGFFGAAPEAFHRLRRHPACGHVSGHRPRRPDLGPFEHVSLRKVAAESGHAQEELPGTPTD